MSHQSSKFSSYDEYGFERPSDFDEKSHEEFMSSYLPVLVRRSQRWQELVKDDYKNISKGRKIKRFVRKGIPFDHRPKVWMILSGADELRRQNADQYFKMLSIRVDANSPTIEQINIDLNRTFPKNIYFSKANPQNLQQSLFNVLLAYSNANPHVGYCQGMNYITGLLLIVTKSEEMSFFLLRSLTEDLLPQYYGPSIPGLITDVEVFAELLKTKVPRIYQHVEALNLPWTLVCSKWFICLYSDVLPVETVLRIWDCLFNEGSKILLRVAITLVVMNEENLLRCKEFAELVTQFQTCTITNKTKHCHEFISQMFEMSSPLPSKSLERMRMEFGVKVKNEKLALEARRKAREKSHT